MPRRTRMPLSSGGSAEGDAHSHASSGDAAASGGVGRLENGSSARSEPPSSDAGSRARSSANRKSGRGERESEVFAAASPEEEGRAAGLYPFKARGARVTGRAQPSL